MAIVSLPANALENPIEEPEEHIAKLTTQEEAKALFDWAME